MRPASSSSRRGTRSRQRIALELHECFTSQHLAAIQPGLGEAEAGPSPHRLTSVIIDDITRSVN